MKRKKSIEHHCENLRNSLLDTIVDNFDYFREHKSHLAWALMNFDLVHRSARMAYDACQDNANDLYRQVVGDMTKDDENLFSDAWDITQMGDGFNYKDYTEEELSGRICYESCGTPIKELAGYTKAEKQVRKDIRDKILAFVKDPLMAGPISDYKKLCKRHLKKHSDLANLLRAAREALINKDKENVERLCDQIIKKYNQRIR